MRISVHSDNTLPLDVSAFCRLLGQTCSTVQFSPGETTLRFDSARLSADVSYEALSGSFRQTTRGDDHVVIASAIPYDNNYFFDGEGKYVIISFSGWNLLTNLPVSNGLAYFIASILCGERNEDSAHEENTGCINDFWWDKRGVDVGMRAAFLCARCTAESAVDPAVLTDAKAILDLVATASRAHRDILSLPAVNVSPTSAGSQPYDVFLCHNTQDKASVRQVDRALRAAGVRTWLDEDRIEPGELWQVALEEQLDSVRAACVFVGDTGLGPWQNNEIRAFLSAFVERACRVIPVILPTASEIPKLPVFLRQMMWLDLRRDYDANIAKLVAVLKPHS